MEMSLLTNSLRRPLETETYAKQSPKSVIEHQERENSIEKWQQQWGNTTNDWYLNNSIQTLKTGIKYKSTTPNFMLTVTAHGKTRPYLH